MVIYSRVSDIQTVHRAENVCLCLVLCALTFLFSFLKVINNVEAYCVMFPLSACHCSLKMASLPLFVAINNGNK